MKRRARLRYWIISGCLVVLAGCAEVPSVATPESRTPLARSVHDEQISHSIAKHRQLAAQYKQSGDLAAAATQWEIVALLAPHDEAVRHELAATQASINHQVQKNLAAESTRFKGGDN